MRCAVVSWWPTYRARGRVVLRPGGGGGVARALGNIPSLGTLPPALFTPVAAQLGLMDELTRLMLRLSLVQHRVWAAAGWVVPISVNVDPDSVTDPGFPAVVAEFLRAEQVPGRMLALEVSEQTGTAAVSISFFAQLAELGVRVALDDFGTGFASLESLGGWPVNELKLDMSLVRPIASNASFRTIVRTTVDLAHQLGVKVVAEGDRVRGGPLRTAGSRLRLRPGLPARAADGARRLRRLAAPAGALPAAHPGAGRRVRATEPVPRRPRVAQAVPSGGCAGSSIPVGGPHPGRRRGHHGGLRAVAGLSLGPPKHQALIGDLAFFLPNAAGGYCAWRVSRRTDLAGPPSGPGGCSSVAIWLYLLGDAIQLIYEVVCTSGRTRPGPTPPTLPSTRWPARPVLVPVAAPDQAGAAAQHARRRHGVRRRGDPALVRGARPGGDVETRLRPADLVIFAYPIGDLLLLFGVLSAVVARGDPQASVTPLRIFATGMLVFIAADVTYDYTTIHAPYHGGDPVDTLWMLALTIVWVAAACQLRAGSARLGGAEAGRRPAQRPALPRGRGQLSAAQPWSA